MQKQAARGRRLQPPARNRESRQTTTTAESGGGGLVSVFAPPYGEDEPPAFLIGTKTPKRGHEGRIIGTKRAKRGHENEGQSLNAARRMVEAGRVFCPPRVQCSPPARKPETAAPPRVFVWPCFGRNSKIQKFNILRRNKTTFAPVFGRFWRVFGRVLDVFGQSQRMQQSSRNSPPRLPTLKHETPRVVSVVETHAAGLRYGRNRGGAFAHLLVSFFLPKGKPNVHHLVTNTLPNKANRRGQSAPQIQGEQTAARYGSPRRRRHAPKQKAPPRRVELAKAHPLNGGYLERHALRARILNAPARIVTQFTPYIHPLQGWRS